ncbi:MAG TPA: serine/threonine-protein kinase [Polyangiaceae bacterium]|nr:serine/threonine-protein kinase [Polyangiaceae bacterium]
MFAKRVSAAHSSASAGPMGLEPGTQLGNHRVLFCTARGGMASVWPALQLGPRGFSKLVALKAILPDLVASPEFEALFIEEARIAARIRHPNVCEVFELIEENGVLALSMEWIDGDALGRVLETPPQPLNPRIAAYIVAQAAAGLHAAHELRDDAGDAMNVVHRDVSSQNILISKDGHVKISDFGIAKAFGSTRDATQAGRVRGKLAYMSPEQASAAATDRRSDVFSLGVVLYQITIGQIPFRQADDTTRTHLTRLLE